MTERQIRAIKYNVHRGVAETANMPITAVDSIRAAILVESSADFGRLLVIRVDVGVDVGAVIRVKI